MEVNLKKLFSDEIIPKGNPFKMPPDSDIFLLRDKERQRKKQVRVLPSKRNFSN